MKGKTANIDDAKGLKGQPGTKVLLYLTLAPLLGISLFLLCWFGFDPGVKRSFLSSYGLGPIIVLLVCMGLVYAVAQVGYFVHLINNEALTAATKLRWVVGFLVCQFIAFLLYWRRYVDVYVDKSPLPKSFPMEFQPKVIVGITVLPYLLALIGWLFIAFGMEPSARKMHSGIFSNEIACHLPLAVAIIWVVVATIGYVIHLIKNKWLEGSQKFIWLLVFVLYGVIGHVAYWYLYIAYPDRLKRPRL